MILPRVVYRAFWAFHKALDRVSRGRLSTDRPSDDGVGTLFLRSIPYGAYARHTRRPIPVVILEPREGPTPAT